MNKLITMPARGWTHSEHNQHDHERALGNRAGVLVFVSRKEEQSTEADLLDIQAYEDMLDCLREEQASGISGRRLVELP